MGKNTLKICSVGLMAVAFALSSQVASAGGLLPYGGSIIKIIIPPPPSAGTGGLVFNPGVFGAGGLPQITPVASLDTAKRECMYIGLPGHGYSGNIALYFCPNWGDATALKNAGLGDALDCSGMSWNGADRCDFYHYGCAAVYHTFATDDDFHRTCFGGPH
jgi:hypothetical protein